VKKLLARREIVPAVLILLALLVGGVTQGHKFLDLHYLLDSTSLYVEGGLLAIGMTLIIISGQIDLSVASNLALVACVSAKLTEAHYSPAIAILAGLALGTGLGWLNGVLVARLQLPSFMVTLAGLAGYRGIAQAMMGSKSAKVPDKLVGIDMAYVPHTPIPLPLAVLIVVAVVTGLILHRTVAGRWIYAVGTNAKASLYSAVPVARVTTGVFIVTGFMAGLAGLIINSRLGVARYDDAPGLELDVITAVVLGGTSIAGGKGSILGTMLALLLVALIRIQMGLANVTAEYQLLVIGVLLVLAVLATNITERLVAKRAMHNSR